MRTLVNRPSTPENLAHGLQSPTELPCKVSSWFHCLWPSGGWASWNAFTARTKLHRNAVAHRLYFECGGTAVGGFTCCALLHVTALSCATQTSECYTLVGVFSWHLKFFLTGLMQRDHSVHLKSSKEVFCFPWLGHFVHTWWVSPYRRLVSIAVWKCPLHED